MRLPPLTMLCTIARRDTTADDYGEPSAPGVVASDVPCYWWAGQVATSAPGNLQSLVAVTIEHVMFAPGQDVRAGDHIQTVTDEFGRVVFTVSDYRVVDGAAFQRNHIDCTLRLGQAIGGRT